jgi:hypothetical protein
VVVVVLSLAGLLFLSVTFVLILRQIVARYNAREDGIRREVTTLELDLDIAQTEVEKLRRALDKAKKEKRRLIGKVKSQWPLVPPNARKVDVGDDWWSLAADVEETIDELVYLSNEYKNALDVSFLEDDAYLLLCRFREKISKI